MPLVQYTDTNLPTPEEIRAKWCFGLPLSKDDGEVMPDEDIQLYIDAAITNVERRLGIYLKPTTIACDGGYRGLEEGVDFDKEEPPYDYDARSWVNYGFLQLRERPVQEITELKLVLPNGQIVMDFMARPEWVKLNKNAGQVRIVPYAGDSNIFGLAGSTMSGYPFITGAIRGNVPQMLYVSYVCGYAQGKVPADIRNVVAKYAAIDTLGIAADAVLAGVGSVTTSIDGLSESFTTTASAEYGTYSSHIVQYQKEVDSFFDAKDGAAARSTERGITMTGL